MAESVRNSASKPVQTAQRRQATAYSKPALAAKILTSLGIIAISFGPFRFRTAHGHLLTRHFFLFGIWDTTLHAWGHFVAFGLLGIFAAFISVRWPIRAISLSAILVLAVSIEVLQQLISPGSQLETWDIKDDALGICLGASLVFAWKATQVHASSLDGPRSVVPIVGKPL